MDRIVESPFPPNPNLSPFDNFTSTLFHSLSKQSSAIAIINVTLDERITFAELKDKSETLAQNLWKMGCRKGDVIAIFSHNSIEFAIVQSAALRLGAVAAGINFLAAPEELKHELNIIKAKYIYTVQSLATVVLEAASEANIMVIVSGGFEGCTSLESLLEEKNLKEGEIPPLPSIDQMNILPDDPAVILFSSGTTGPGKAVVITQRNLQISYNASTHPWTVIMFPKQLVYTPQSHLSGWMLTMFGVAVGNQSLLQTRFDLQIFLKSLQDYKLDGVFVVPATATLLAKSPEVNSYHLESLKHLVCGGASLSKEVEELLMERFPGLAIKQGYGMTEIGFCAIIPLTYDVKTRPKMGSTGVPMFGIQMKVVDVGTAASLGPGQQGEICMKGDSATVGYMNNPEATSALKDKDGFIHSGDIGYYDEDGYFFIVDRLKELIKYNALEGTYQVSPSELEAIILTHPEVADAGVIGLPDPNSGELPLAWVVKKTDATITEKDIDDFVAGKVASYKRLRGGITFVKSIPKSPSGKILRRQIKEMILKGEIYKT